MTIAIPEPAAQLAVPAAQGIDSWIQVAEQVVALAAQICNTPFVPDGLRGSAPATAAAILAGREMGLGPMTSLQHIHVIKGKPGQSALLMRALIIAAGHEWQDADVSDTRVLVRGRRKGESEWAEASFTADQAKRAGIALGGYPQDKLYARATVRLARRKFADVIMGMPYSAEELEDGFDDGPVTEATPAAEAPKPAQRTARRRAAAERPTVSPGARTAQGDDSAASAASRAEPDLPPLPGEDDQAETIDKDAPGSVTRPQLTKLGAIFTSYGFTTAEREQRLATASTIVSRELESSSELSLNEARVLIDTLERCGDRERLMTLLATGEMPDDGAGDA